MPDKSAFVSGALLCVQRYRGNLYFSHSKRSPAGREWICIIYTVYGGGGLPPQIECKSVGNNNWWNRACLRWLDLVRACVCVLQAYEQQSCGFPHAGSSMRSQSAVEVLVSSEPEDSQVSSLRPFGSDADAGPGAQREHRDNRRARCSCCTPQRGRLNRRQLVLLYPNQPQACLRLHRCGRVPIAHSGSVLRSGPAAVLQPHGISDSLILPSGRHHALLQLLRSLVRPAYTVRWDRLASGARSAAWVLRSGQLWRPRSGRVRPLQWRLQLSNGSSSSVIQPVRCQAVVSAGRVSPAGSLSPPVSTARPHAAHVPAAAFGATDGWHQVRTEPQWLGSGRGVFLLLSRDQQTGALHASGTHAHFLRKLAAGRGGGTFV